LLKRIIAPIAISAAILTGASSVAFAGSAYASTPTVSASKSNNGAAAWLHAHRRAVARAVVAVSAKTIGVTSQDLVSELRSGKSIAEVAGENNVSAEAVVTALVSAGEAAVNKAVTSNKLTSTQASTIDAALPGYMAKVVNHTF
jgi:hypothetical protein